MFRSNDSIVLMSGIKGKIADSWAVGTPVVTTPIGAEGMGYVAPTTEPTEPTPLHELKWGGLVALTAAEFIEYVPLAVSCTHTYIHALALFGN